MKKIFSLFVAALMCTTLFADKQLYLRVSTGSEGWNDVTKFAIYYFNDTQNGWTDFMTPVEENVYSATIPDGMAKVIFTRQNKDAETPNWDNRWSQTVNKDLPTDDKDLFTITSGGRTWECDGEWSKFVPSETPVTPDPEVPVIKIAGDFNDWTATALTPVDENTASITVNLNKAQNWGFKMIVGEKWLSAGEEGVDYKRGDAAIAVKHEGGMGNNVFIVADIAGEYTITWTYADSTVAVAFPELPEITLADGYYVIGLTGWSIYSLSASLKLEESEGAEVPEYVLKNVVLTEGQEMKVVEVKDKKLGNWYGMKDDKNYQVTSDVAGTRDIYFRPTYNEAWEGHIFVNWEDATAIDNAKANAKAVKSIENGMLIIRREGKTYNVLGVEMR